MNEAQEILFATIKNICNRAVVNGRGEAVGLVSHSAGPFTQAVPIGRALAVAAQLEPVVP